MGHVASKVERCGPLREHYAPALAPCQARACVFFRGAYKKGMKTADKPMLALRVEPRVLAHLRKLAAVSRQSQTRIIEALILAARLEPAPMAVRGDE